MATYVAKLIKGIQTLDLASGRYEIDPDFVPPSTSFATNISTGTSANTSGAGRVVSRAARPRGMTLPVIVRGSSNAEVEIALNDIEYMLSLAGDESEPLYFYWRPHDYYSFEPLFGTHDAYKRYEILAADDRAKWDYYGTATLRDVIAKYEIGLTINPYATARRQRAAVATGLILEDWPGTTDGRSRGVIVSGGAANLVTNPVFGHATWNNSWSVSNAALLATENKNRNFILFGSSSARLVNTSGANGYTFRISVTAPDTTDHTASFFVKRPDGAAVTTNDVAVDYNGDLQTTEVFEVGNGWYRLKSTFSGIAAGTNLGVRVKAARVIYLDGAHFNDGGILLPFRYGDMVGMDWSGTSHASTSTVTGGVLKIPLDANTFSTMEGTIRAVVRMNEDSTDLNADAYIWADGAGMNLQWDNSDTRYTFSDATNDANTTNTPFTLGDIVVFHCVYSVTGGLKLYVDGSQEGSNADYTTKTPASYIWIGDTSVAGSRIHATFLDFETFSKAMSATEVADDYANLTQAANGPDGLGQSLSPIPYCWTDDGDLIIDNAYDSDSENFAIFGGIPGNAGADTLWNLTMGAGFSTVGTLGLSRFETSLHVLPKKAGASKSGWLDYLYEDYDGTGSDSQYSSDEYGGNAWSAAVGSNGNSGFTNALTDPLALREIFGREWCLIAKISEADNDLRLAVTFKNSSLGSVTGDHRTITTASTFYFVHSGFLYLGPLPSDPAMDGLTYSSTWIPYPDVLSGTSVSDVDFAMAVPRPLIIFGNADESNTGVGIIYRSGEERARVSTSGGAFAGTTDVSGDRDFELIPDKLNYIFAFTSLEAAINPVAGRNVTFTAVYVSPRWSLA